MVQEAWTLREGLSRLLKSLLKRCEDFITFIDESMYLSYAKSTWWIDLGATVHVANSLQGFRTRTLQRGERRIKVANVVEAEVKAIGDLSLELDDGFRLQLSNNFYVPSLHRNLISVSRLHDDGYDCHFGNGKCRIVYCRISGTPRGVNRPIKIQLKLKSNSLMALPHLHKRLVHSSKSSQRNLYWVYFLASCRVVDHRSTAESSGNTTHK